MGNFGFDSYINDYDEQNIENINIKNNEINGIIKIESNKLKQRIINSYENWKRENPDEYDWNKDSIDATPNEEKIKQCEIYINDKKIEFSYYYEFPNNGIFRIKYIFKKAITSISFLFYRCKSLISLDLSKFYSDYMCNMCDAFSFCSSLKSINLNNFNTSKVRNMRFLFHYCNSLINIDLSSFNTKNVTNMEYMFFKCSNLLSVNLSNFDTSQVNNMECMFYNCCSLINLNLSNFNFTNVTNNRYMFEKCHSLIILNIPNFKMKDGQDIDHIFYECNSLILNCINNE